MVEKFVPYHQHLLIKCWITNPPKDVDVLNNWFVNLVNSVDMNVVAGPTSVYVSDPGNEGLTGTVTLSTSHSSIHIWDKLELPMAQFDIYSCKPFNLETVIENLKLFGLTKYDWVMIDRNDGLSVVSKGEWELI